MRTRHTTLISASCPRGGADVYDATFTFVDRLLPVEEIQAEINYLTIGAIYQEDLTRLLAEKLRCEVQTVGRHGKFDTRCVHDGSIKSEQAGE